MGKDGETHEERRERLRQGGRFILLDKLSSAIELRRDGQIIASTTLLETIEEKDGRVNFECGWNYSIQANVQQAITYYERSIKQELPPQYLKEAYMDLAFNYFEQQRFKKAAAILDKGISEFGDSEAFRAMQSIVDYKLGDTKEAMVDLMYLLLTSPTSKEIRKYRTELMYYVQR